MARLLTSSAATTLLETGSHPILIGQTVAVIRAPPDREAFVEGVAVIRRRCEQPHHYLVAFAGDPVPRERLIHPDYQADPRRLLSILNDLRRAETDGARLSDFFPEDILPCGDQS